MRSSSVSASGRDSSDRKLMYSSAILLALAVGWDDLSGWRDM